MTSLAERPDDANLVDAQPTKDFFISMLTRDIDLKDAVVDLVDNSVDGARRMRPDQDFQGLRVDLSFTADSFSIRDNCGGMPVEVARHYAFRFGRDTRERRHRIRSIGQFGVGMKRTLFKMGTRFRVESWTVSEHFVLEVVVDDWRNSPDWDFRFSHLDQSTTRPAAQAGTSIVVSPLHEDVGLLVTDDKWVSDLEDDLRLKHGQSIRNGVRIALDGAEVDVEELQLLSADGLRPAVVHDEFPAPSPVEEDSPDSTVEVKLVAGVGTRSRDYAGWYVYCNGRLVLGPDKTRTTTWGARTPARVPIYHDQFARFRGYAFFESDDPSRLPWTTTKTGVDVDSGIWKATRARMITMTRPVIDFLNLLDKQNTAAGGFEAAGAEPTPPSEDAPFAPPPLEYAERALAQARPLPVLDIARTPSGFVHPAIDAGQFPDPPVRVTFIRDRSEVDAVRAHLGPSDEGRPRSTGELGEEAWEYFWRNEIQG